MKESLRNILNIPDLRKRLAYTFMVLAIFRVGAQIPIPGINGAALAEIFSQGGMALGLLNLASGGAMSRTAIFALGIMPYITASIIFQLLVVVWPYLEKLQKEGGVEGRRKITQWTRYSTVGICLVQALGVSYWLRNLTAPNLGKVVTNPTLGYHLTVILILTTGGIFLMWLGEQITERGLGNGISLLIFGGIVVGLGPATSRMVAQVGRGERGILGMLLLCAFMVAVVAIVVYFERAVRRIPIQYARQVRGSQMVGGQGSFFPLRLNPGGVMPIIFAVSIMGLPQMIFSWLPQNKYPWLDHLNQALQYGTFTYLLLYGILILFFTYYYTTIIFNPEDLSDNLKKSGAFIPGIRPGKRTGDYLYKVLNRLLVVGALYLVIVAVLPILILSGLPLDHIPGIGVQLGEGLNNLNLGWILHGLNVQFYFGGTSLLIVVQVLMDFIQQLESQLVMRHYDGIMKGGRRRRRRVR